ncbi:ribbon-helix-helix domain-containing protein [Stutzerimonas nitrititolerans]|uniref:ribbon-helix-helix domain-containing protein n=1 Tax=Stutzerimonas nitrititolerans TaxID=2482751 RepID=UPI0028B007D8|nr:ribbon-helix-helix domain-containing protein [Stutzerimonas nitrititolerans]
MFIPAKENEIKARFDDETYEELMAACRKYRVRRAVLVRQIVEAWLAEHEEKTTAPGRVA